MDGSQLPVSSNPSTSSGQDPSAGSGQGQLPVASQQSGNTQVAQNGGLGLVKQPQIELVLTQAGGQEQRPAPEQVPVNQPQAAAAVQQNSATAVAPPQAVVTQALPETTPAVSQSTPIQAVGQVVQAGVGQPLQGQGAAIPQTNQSANVGVMQKEQMVAPVAPEKVPLVELSENEKIPEEVEGWMEKLEQAGEIKIPEAIKQDKQVILDNAAATTVQDTVVLPMSQSGAAVAAKKTVGDSARWLYVWCVRLVKILGERARWGKDQPAAQI